MKTAALERSFDAAVKRRQADKAWSLAGQLGDLSLARALRLTVVLGLAKAKPFERAARRFLARLVDEKEPSLKLTSWIAEDLDHVGNPECPFFVRQRAELRLERIGEWLEGRKPRGDGPLGT